MQRLKHEHRERGWQAWWAGYLSHDFKDGFPSLDSVVGPARPPTPKTDDQLLGIARMWDAALKPPPTARASGSP